MEFSQLEFFVTVVEEGSFSKAALRVYRTQPAVSIAIRRFSERLPKDRVLHRKFSQVQKALNQS